MLVHNKIIYVLIFVSLSLDRVHPAKTKDKDLEFLFLDENLVDEKIVRGAS